jgi:hypothetical protein
MTEPRSAEYKELGGLDDIDYPQNEQVFSWNRDSPYIRPETYKCNNCNHSFVGRERCDGRKCEKCGYPIKLYGYPDLVQDPFFDMNEIPYDFGENGYYDNTGYDANTQNEYRSADHNLPKITEETEESVSEMIPDHLSRDAPPLDYIAQTYHDIPNVSKPSNYIEVKNDNKNMKEHMDASSGAIFGFVSSRICLILLAFCIANYRGELRKNGEINLSLIVCVILFPDIYFTYALFEWLVRPKC